MTLLESLKSRFTKRSSDYEAIVRAEASGDDIDHDTAVDALLAASKTPEEFSADVERQRQRAEWRALLDSEPDIRADLSELADVEERAKMDFERKVAELRQELQREVAATSQRRDQLNAELSRIRQARSQLEQTCDPALLQQQQSVTDQLASERYGLKTSQQQCHSLAYRLQHAKEDDNRTANEALLKQAEKLRDKHQAAVDRLQSDLEDIQRQKLEA